MAFAGTIIGFIVTAVYTNIATKAIIQSFMGHNSPNETKTYMHITREEFNTAINSINTTSHINSLANLMKENNISEDLLVGVINTIKNNKKKEGYTNVLL